MCIENTIMNTLNVFTADSAFCVNAINYDERSFGNIYIEMHSCNQVGVRIINDRGVFWCEVGKSGEWHFIEDVFKVFDIEIKSVSLDFIAYLIETANLLNTNIDKVHQAFDDENIEVTKAKVKAIAIKRVAENFSG